jgi:hypothetical protein
VSSPFPNSVIYLDSDTHTMFSIDFLHPDVRGVVKSDVFDFSISSSRLAILKITEFQVLELGGEDLSFRAPPSTPRTSMRTTSTLSFNLAISRFTIHVSNQSVVYPTLQKCGTLAVWQCSMDQTSLFSASSQR